MPSGAATSFWRNEEKLRSEVPAFDGFSESTLLRSLKF